MITPTTTTLKLPPTPLMSTASKLGDSCSLEATLTTQSGLQDSPTRILPPTTAHAAVNLPIDNDQQHLPPFHTVKDPANDDIFFTYLDKWCGRNNKNFDYSLELDALTEACKRMQQWPMATPVTPTILPTAMNHSQQSLMTLLQWCNRDNEDDNHPSAIDKLSAECNGLQCRWPHAMLMAAPTLLELNPNQQPTEPNPHDTITYLEEFINSTMEDNTINQPTAPDGH